MGLWNHFFLVVIALFGKQRAQYHRVEGMDRHPAESKRERETNGESCFMFKPPTTFKIALYLVKTRWQISE